MLLDWCNVFQSGLLIYIDLIFIELLLHLRNCEKVTFIIRFIVINVLKASVHSYVSNWYCNGMLQCKGSCITTLHFKFQILGQWISCDLCNDLFQDSELLESHKKWKHRKMTKNNVKAKDIVVKKPKEVVTKRKKLVSTEFSCSVCEKNLSRYPIKLTTY